MIHRFAVTAKHRNAGVAFKIITAIKQLFKEKVDSIRIDTHPKNVPMQRLLEKC